jgi:hypothetical protein
MERQRLVGITLTIAGLIGYISGIYIAYPGRAFSIAVLMVGIALAAIPASTSSEGAV